MLNHRPTPLLQWLLLPLFMIAPCLLSAQTGNTVNTPDSLNRLLQANPGPAVQMKLLHGLSDYWRSRDARKAITYARQLRNLAQDQHNKLYIAIAFMLEGNARNGLDQLDSAEEQYGQALALLTPLKDREALRYQARVWNNKGIILQKKDSNEQYLRVLLYTVIPLAQKIADSPMLAHTYANVTSLMVNSGQHDQALPYFDAIVSTYRKFLTPEMEASAYLTFIRGTLFSTVPDMPSARKYLSQARALLARDTTSRVWVVYYGMAGSIAFNDLNFTKALQCFDSGLVLNARWKVGYDALTLVWGKAETYYKLNRLKEAKEAMYELDKFVSIYNRKADRLALLRKLSILEEATGNYPAAYRKLKEYVLHMDTANVLKANVALLDLEEKYQNVQKEHEIERLQSTALFNRYLTLLFITLTLLLILLLFQFRYRYRARKKAAEQEALFLQQKIAQQEQRQQYEVAKALLEGEERERRRLAGDLHDGLGGMLATARMNLTGLAFQQGETSPELDKVIGQLDQSVSELRRIARNMMPEALLRSGLEVALTELCMSLPSDRIHADYQMIGIPEKSPGQQELILYRIVQELLANVLRHAEATEVFVQCSQHSDIFHVTVEDNGKGWDSAHPTQRSGIGLDNVRNRVEFLRGKMDIRSTPGKGTAVDVELNLS
ncbi:sensor histidine kinase [Taibaiella koreensis]|uniref:sensor histidine kinase n=1 Tax=Taibaiella koreensis TaxID=1268548 RepID=UPI000E59C035|nr:ATP-binding protein [Taibaiella koreensis]